MGKPFLNACYSELLWKKRKLSWTSYFHPFYSYMFTFPNDFNSGLKLLAIDGAGAFCWKRNFLNQVVKAARLIKLKEHIRLGGIQNTGMSRVRHKNYNFSVVNTARRTRAFGVLRTKIVHLWIPYRRWNQYTLCYGKYARRMQLIFNLVRKYSVFVFLLI